MSQKKSPINYLSDYCEQLVEHSKVLNGNSTSPVSPISEILDMAVAYIHDILKKNGGDLDTHIMEDTAIFDAKLEKRVNNFQISTNDKLDQISQKIKTLQKSIAKKQEAIDSLIGRLQIRQKRYLQQIDQKNQRKMGEIERKYEIEKQVLRKVQQQQYDNFEFELSSILSQLTKEWETKFISIDNQIKLSQKNLQDSVHIKHQSNVLLHY